MFPHPPRSSWFEIIVVSLKGIIYILVCVCVLRDVFCFLWAGSSVPRSEMAMLDTDRIKDVSVS